MCGFIKEKAHTWGNLAKTKGMAPVGFHKGKKMTHTPVEKGNQEGKVEQKCTEVIRVCCKEKHMNGEQLMWTVIEKSN